ncbi:MAG TPA: thioredoxin fold domain-containing protein [Scandinavium sp.]|jgi:TrbB protein
MITISRKEGPFEAEITGGLLSVRRDFQPIFTCRMNVQPWFVVHSDGLYAQNAHDALTPLYRGEDSNVLLLCLSSVLRHNETRRAGIRLAGVGVVIAALFIATVVTLSTPKTHEVPAVYSPLTASVPAPDSAPVLTPSSLAPGVRTVASENTPAEVPQDGWSLSAEARAALPDKLHKAASRGLFTVPLSSGHTRTIYVFSDPECANCQRMERHFETASGQVNVVIFPVTTEGGQDSLAALTPVMALPEAERAIAWKTLFSVDAGMSVPGATAAGPLEPEKAEIARGAIGVNEVAFRAYRLPGTPWTISDDGRYVSQAVLSSPAALKAFLEGGNHDGQ